MPGEAARACVTSLTLGHVETMADDDNGHAGAAPETILAHAGRRPEEHFGFVNTPVFRGSTILFRTLAELDDYGAPYRYGRQDNPTTRSVAALVTELERAEGTVLAPSGMAAIATALLSVLDAGDEILVTDSCYEPTRVLCEGTLRRFGISVRFYDPRIGAGIAELFSERTRAVFVESPGSLTFEIQDLPAISAAARARDVAIVVDNSWATPLYHKPLSLGADVVVHAGTKMFVGHSDAMFGTVSASARVWPRLQLTHRQLGLTASPDDAFLAARGIRTLAIRMKEHEQRAVELAQWLGSQPMVRALYHPALPTHPDHALFKRDFSGSGSLFSVLLAPAHRSAVAAMVDDFRIFGMGYSWGGYESLCLPVQPARTRSAVPWSVEGNMMRIHVGFEDVDELKADLAAGLERYREATASR